MDLPFLLAATPRMEDPVFRRSVILLIEYDATGAMGFVINNKSHMMLDEVVAHDFEEIPPGIPVWNAGPIDLSSGFILHNQSKAEFEKEIAPGVLLSASQNTLKKMINDTRAGASAEVQYPYRLLVGYAGWGAGQLESEFRLGAWVKAPIDHQILFGMPCEQIWSKTLEVAGLRDGLNFSASHLAWVH